MTENICGYQVFNENLEDCISKIGQHLITNQNKEKMWLACANPHSLYVAAEDDSFSDALHEADLLVPDGVGVIVASKLLGGQIENRITGSDIFEGLSVFSNNPQLDKPISYFFIGSTNETLGKIQQKLGNDFPNIDCVGIYSPPFKAEFSEADIDEMVRVINEVKPDVLWVGMTAPKQEKWIATLMPRLDIKFAAAVGAVFDFYTGNVQRSPEIYQRLGLEWLPRLVQQPRRLWKRVFISGPFFLYMVFCQKLKANQS